MLDSVATVAALIVNGDTHSTFCSQQDQSGFRPIGALYSPRLFFKVLTGRVQRFQVRGRSPARLQMERPLRRRRGHRAGAVHKPACGAQVRHAHRSSRAPHREAGGPLSGSRRSPLAAQTLVAAPPPPSLPVCNVLSLSLPPSLPPYLPPSLAPPSLPPLPLSCSSARAAVTAGRRRQAALDMVWAAFSRGRARLTPRQFAIRLKRMCLGARRAPRVRAPSL